MLPILTKMLKCFFLHYAVQLRSESSFVMNLGKQNETEIEAFDKATKGGGIEKKPSCFQTSTFKTLVKKARRDFQAGSSWVSF